MCIALLVTHNNQLETLLPVMSLRDILLGKVLCMREYGDPCQELPQLHQISFTYT
jgi:hypothetical protein